MTFGRDLSMIKTLWLLFIGAHLIMAIIGATGLAIRTPDEGAELASSTVLFAYPIIAVIELFIALGLRHKFYFKPLRAGKFADLQQRTILYSQYSLISFGFAYGANLMGLVLSVITREPHYSLPFAALSLIVHLTLRPKQAHIDA